MARIGGVTLQIVRDWLLPFNEWSHQWRKAGKPSKLKQEQRQALAQLVEAGPIPAVHGVVRWRRKDLARWIFR